MLESLILCPLIPFGRELALPLQMIRLRFLNRLFRTGNVFSPALHQVAPTLKQR